MNTVTANEVPFDHLNVRARQNPPFPATAVKIDAFPLVGRTAYLDPRRVKPMRGQPRTSFDGIEELAVGIKSFGQKTTILVHPIAHPEFDVELQAGERRTMACTRAGIMIRAEIRQVPQNAEEHFVDAFVENYNREPLTCLETVYAIRRLLNDGHSRKDIVEMSGKTYTWVTQFAILATLHPDVLPLLDEQQGDQRSTTGRKLRRRTVLPMTIALQIAKIPREKQPSFVQEALEKTSSISDIRLMVEKYLGKRGEQVGMRSQSTNERFDSLVRQITNSTTFFNRFLDISSPELHNILHNQHKSDRDDLAKSIRQLTIHLNCIADAANADVKKIGRDVVAERRSHV